MYLAKIAALLFSFTFPLSVFGATQTVFVPVKTGVFDDASLAGVSTYAMRVSADTDWTKANSRIELTSDTINHLAPAYMRSPSGANGFGDTARLAPTAALGSIIDGFAV